MISPWFPYANPLAGAKLRLFCFHYAGGNAALFRSWLSLLSPDIDVFAVQLPGRLQRFREPAFDAARELVPVLAAQVEPLLDRPFALFGVSMGALLAFEVARTLARRGRVAERLFIAARGAPSERSPLPPLHLLNDAELVEMLRTFNGTPPELLDAPELMELVLPVLRADLSVTETYRYAPGEPLRCGITALRGIDDWITSRKLMLPWAAQTVAGFELIELDGDHFFVETARDDVVALIRARLGVSGASTRCTE